MVRLLIQILCKIYVLAARCVNIVTHIKIQCQYKFKTICDITAEEVSDQVEKIVTVKPGVYCEAAGLELETIPAYNILKLFHPKNAGWVGYILRIDGKRIYISGDTDDTKECKAVMCDIALIPIGGTYTMDARKAAELINTIRPEVAIPTHYGSIVGKPSDGETFAKYVKPPIKVEFKIPF
jgi:L-ascorbate metabolism protein UlaG (beta-lactamase superfamily)